MTSKRPLLLLSVTFPMLLYVAACGKKPVPEVSPIPDPPEEVPPVFQVETKEATLSYTAKSGDALQAGAFLRLEEDHTGLLCWSLPETPVHSGLVQPVKWEQAGDECLIQAGSVTFSASGLNRVTRPDVEEAFRSFTAIEPANLVLEQDSWRETVLASGAHHFWQFLEDSPALFLEKESSADPGHVVLVRYRRVSEEMLAIVSGLHIMIDPDPVFPMVVGNAHLFMLVRDDGISVFSREPESPEAFVRLAHPANDLYTNLWKKLSMVESDGQWYFFHEVFIGDGSVDYFRFMPGGSALVCADGPAVYLDETGAVNKHPWILTGDDLKLGSDSYKLTPAGWVHEGKLISSRDDEDLATREFLLPRPASDWNTQIGQILAGFE